MQNLLFSLDKIIEYANFQEIQDKIADYLNLAIVTVDYKGKPVTKHSNCTEHCTCVRENNESCRFCEQCDSLGGIEAARNMKPYIYVCHQGLVDIAIPILYNNIYLGAIMVGQVVLKDLNEQDKLNIIKSNSAFNEFKSYEDLPKLSYERIKAIADLMFFFCNKILALSIESLTKNSYKQDIPTNLNRHEKNADLLQPALSYIRNNYEKKITLEDLSMLCNITPTYFSRLFKKTTNMNLINYLNKIRVEQAKVSLLSTDKKISQIASDVGFNDCGYFIKVFKQLEKTTPNSFRNNGQE